MALGTRSKSNKGDEETEARATGEHRKEDFKKQPPQASATTLKKAQEKAEKEATLAALRHSLTPKKVTPKGSPASASVTGNLSETSASSGLNDKQVPAMPKFTAAPKPPSGPAPPLPADVPSATAGPLTSLLAQMAALNAKLDNLATKDDLTQLRTDLEHTVQDQVKVAVEPVQAEVRALATRLTKVEQGKPATTRDPTDPAPKRADFVGLTGSVEERLAAMQEYCKKYPTHSPVAVGNYYKGSRDQRVLKNSGYAEFADSDAAREFLKQAKGSTHLRGASVSVRPGKSKLNAQRDWALHKARELLEAAAPQKKVELVRNSRSVTVDSVVAFKQEKNEAGGTFCGNYGHLALP